MYKQLSDKLSSLLTTAMRDAIRSRRLDPSRVPFKVHVAERAVSGAIFLGASFPTLHARAQIRSSFWNAVARLPFGFFRATSSFERSIDVPVVLPGAEEVAAFDAAEVLRTLLGEEVYQELTVEDVHLLLGTYAIEERPFGAFADNAYGQGAEGSTYWTVTQPTRQGTMAALGGARYGSETDASNAIKTRCDLLLADVELARVG